MKRTIEQWRACSPASMALQSEAAILYAFRDAKADILELYADKREERITIGEYTLSPMGTDGDYWIENAAGEGMQVFGGNLEKLIDDYFKSEF